MRFLIITDSYPPEVRSASHLMRDLADALAKRGNEVSVVTSYPYHNLSGEIGRLEKDSREGNVRVVRVKTAPHHGVNFILRGFAQLALPFQFVRATKKNIPSADVVFVHTPPLPLGWAAWKLKRRYKAKFILNVHDIFPQNAVDLDILKVSWIPFSRPILRFFFERLERALYKRADSILVPSEGHKAYLFSKRGVESRKVHILPHWADVDEFDAVKSDGSYRARLGLEKKLVFFFGGVLGPSQGLERILDIAEAVKNEQKISFLFAGDGSERPRLQEIAERKDLKNVSFTGFVSKSEYPKLAMEMDVGLVSLISQNRTPIFPAKIAGYMAAGLPVLALVNAESIRSTLVDAAECGYVIPFDEKAKAIETIRKISVMPASELKQMGERGKLFAREKLTAAKAAEKLEALK
jgi:glycosyltransferase involved in cell wall biosynthesis